MKKDIDTFLQSGKYLPKPLRDFHDAKEVLKTIHGTMNIEKNEYARKVNWITGSCYVIDVFLWFMARRGWTMQRSRANVDFLDLNEDIELRRKKDAEMLTQMLADRKNKTVT